MDQEFSLWGWFYDIAIRKALGFVLTMVPGWLWVIILAVAIAIGWNVLVWIYKKLGWPGIGAIGAAIAGLAVYRWGRLDERAGKPNNMWPEKQVKAPKRGNAKGGIFDNMFKRSDTFGKKRHYNPDTNQFE